MSHDPLSDIAYLLEETCNATCPQKCSSVSWKVYDSDKKNWILNNVLNIDCGIIVPFEHPTKFTCTNIIYILWLCTFIFNLFSIKLFLVFLLAPPKDAPRQLVDVMRLDVQLPAIVKITVAGSVAY